MPEIRLATAADASAIAAIYAPAVHDSATSFELVAPDAGEMARRVAAVSDRLPWLVLDAGAELGGYAYATLHRERAAYQWSVEVSVYVAAGSQRRGVGRALYTSLFAVLRTLGYVNAYAGITLPNPSSLGFHTAFGFQPVGTYHGIGYKFGAWHDVIWLERQIVPRSDVPDPPRRLGDALADPAVAEAIRAGESALSGALAGEGLPNEVKPGPFDPR